MENNYVFFDLETNGLDYYKTSILQITIINYQGKILLNQYAFPFDNRIECSEIHGIDENKLNNEHALNHIDLCVLIKNVIRNNFDRNNVYFIAYNNFGFDQIILENYFRVSNIKIPINWYFIDLYPIIKELYPEMKPNYKLSTVYKNICNSKNVNFHCALEDTLCLYEIFSSINISNELLKKYTRSLITSYEILSSPISSLNGYNKYINFQNKNIKTIGDLYNIFKNKDYNNEEFEIYLKDKLNIYSNYYLKNIMKQINTIYNLNS